MARNLSSHFKSKLAALSRSYHADPTFPHLILNDALDAKFATDAASEFPLPSQADWKSYSHYNEKKLALDDFSKFPKTLKAIVEELNSADFVGLLSQVTGIPNLLADPSLAGGGLHLTKPGGFLNLHRDFTAHHTHKTWQRRLNLILYLNPQWKNEWGGAIEFWDSKVKKRVLKISPLLNTLVLFDIFSGHYHGYPTPISSPPGEGRKSIAFYYYVDQSKGAVIERSTAYHPQPSDPLLKRSLIQVENGALRSYSFLRRRFQFSDHIATTILPFFFDKPSAEERLRTQSCKDPL